MSVTKRQIAIAKFLCDSCSHHTGAKNRVHGFMTKEQAAEISNITGRFVSHVVTIGEKRYVWFSDFHLYGYIDEENQLKDVVPCSAYLPSTVVPRPELPDGIICTLDDHMRIFHEDSELINDFNKLVEFIDQHNLYTGE